MENQNYKQMDEEVIDLKELMFFILRKWRVLILAGLIGVVLGGGLGLVHPKKTVDDLEIDELHLKEISQYARYQELYDEQLRKEAESVYMNMDPANVWRGNKIYFFTAHESDMIRISEMYNSIFRDERIYKDLIDVSGLECSEKAISELAWISFSKYEREEKENQLRKVAFTFQHDNLFEMAKILTESDLKSIKSNNSFYDVLNEKDNFINKSNEIQKLVNAGGLINYTKEKLNK